MTDHRTTAENDLARAIHALADAIATHARDCPTPSWSCGKCARIEAIGHDDGQIAEHHRTCPHAPPRPGMFTGPTAPRVCDRRWSEMSGAHHECVLLAGHDTDRHQCECGAGCYDDDEGSSVCPADGCGRPDGHDGDHRAGEPLTLPTMTAKRGGLRYRGQTIETQGSTLHATPFVALHTNEGGDTSALATDVPDGSHEHGSAPAPDRLPPIVRSARTCADLTTNPRFAEVFMTCADVIEGMHRDATGQRVLMDSYERQIRALAQQNGQLRDQRDRESELRLAAQQAAVDPDLHQKLRRIDNVLRGALNAERAPSTLPFIDLVTDLGLRADAVVDDLTSERESRATVFETAKTLSQAIVHTVDYVGNDMLPAAEGWSWYDALRQFDSDAANRFLINPVRPKAGQ
ncbi:hypothetical protein SEA_CHADMASTERC_59 [Gordonia phage ChadMasterC]|nr:hypothetical protein SEA_CHADMASTERC_59 [Gordonia phage ChadMasterC]